MCTEISLEVIHLAVSFTILLMMACLMETGGQVRNVNALWALSIQTFIKRQLVYFSLTDRKLRVRRFKGAVK